MLTSQQIEHSSSISPKMVNVRQYLEILCSCVSEAGSREVDRDYSAMILSRIVPDGGLG